MHKRTEEEEEEDGILNKFAMSSSWGRLLHCRVGGYFVGLLVKLVDAGSSYCSCSFVVSQSVIHSARVGIHCAVCTRSKLQGLGRRSDYDNNEPSRRRRTKRDDQMEEPEYNGGLVEFSNVVVRIVRIIICTKQN